MAKEKVKISIVPKKRKKGTEIPKGTRGFLRKVSLLQNAMEYKRELVYQ